jgi:hypothetical protein
MVEVTFMKRLTGRTSKPIILLIFGPIAIAGLIIYKNIFIIEPGILGAIGTLIYELYGTKKKLWSYSSPSIYRIAGRVPITVILTYFFGGMVAAVYILYRLS